MKRTGIALFLLCLCCCTKSGRLEPEQLRNIADSASNAAWSGTATKPTTHSTLFDSLYRYYASAALIEKTRQRLEDSLTVYVPILQSATAALNDSLRHAAILAFQSAMMSNDSLHAALRNTIDQCSHYVDTTLKRSYDPGSRTQLRAYLLKPERFAPNWRPIYDSLEQLTNGVVIDLLGLFDSAHGNVIFDSAGGNRFRFRDIDLTSRYNALRDSLAHLGTEQDVQRRSTPTARS